MGRRTGRRRDGALDWPEHAPLADGASTDDRIDWATPDGAMRPARLPRPGPSDDTGDDSAGAGVSREAEHAEVAVLRTLVADLQAENAELRAENATLRRQLGERPLSAPRAGRARKGSVSRRG